jgi:hypothetical protein
MCEHASMTRTALIFGLGLLGACHTTPATVPSEDVRRLNHAIPEAPTERCLRYAEPPGDPDLRGRPRTHPVRCCPSSYGFDPELARQSCGFVDYLGESEELACVHRFRGTAGQTYELRLTPILDLAFTEAIAVHESGEFGPEHVARAPAALPEIWWSADEGRRWAFVPGWSIVRRLGWDEAACDPEHMLPVLARMRESTDDPAATLAVPRRIDEPSSPTSPDASLLALSFEHRATDHRYPLPRAAAQLVHDLLGAAVADELPRFAALLEPGARIGLPDRRQLAAEAMIDEAGAGSAARRLLDAAARLPASSALLCPDIDRRIKPEVTRGELLMWCFWMSEDGLDVLAFGLRGRVSDGEADGRVAYVGVFPDKPEAALVMPGEPPPPPVVAVPELVCGDPHTSAYPGSCPEPEAEPTDAEADDPP